VQALVAHLTWQIAEQVTGQLAKAREWQIIYERRLLKAKQRDGQEGTPPQVTASDLLMARRGWRGHFADFLRRPLP